MSGVLIAALFLLGTDTEPDAARIHLSPEELALGTAELDVLLDIPAGVQGWAYGVCIQDCDRARFLGVVEPPHVCEVVPPFQHVAVSVFQKGASLKGRT